MNKRVIAAIVAAVLAMAGLAVVTAYVSGANDRAFAGASMVTVYQATKAIPADASSEMVLQSVEEVRLPAKGISADAVRHLSDLEKLRTTVPIVPGEVLIAGRFDADGSSSSAGSSRIPTGMQEISLSLEPAAAVGAAVQAGSKVGLIATITPPGDGATPLTRMFAQDVLVTDVSGMSGGESGIVTFAVDGPLATQITAVIAQGGSIRLTAQNPETAKDGGVSVDARTLVK